MTATPFELACTTDVLLREIADPKATQTQVASTYGLAILSTWPTDWPRVNEALVARWGAKGRDRVKRAAWKRIEEVRRG